MHWKVCWNQLVCVLRVGEAFVILCVLFIKLCSTDMKRTSRASLQFQWWPRCTSALMIDVPCTCFWSHTSCKRCLCYGSFCIARKSCQIWHCLLPSRHCLRGFSYGLLADLPLLAAMRGQVQKDEAPASAMENSREWTDPSTSVDTNVSSLIGILVWDSPTPGNYNWLSDMHSEQVTWKGSNAQNHGLHRFDYTLYSIACSSFKVRVKVFSSTWQA